MGLVKYNNMQAEGGVNLCLKAITPSGEEIIPVVEQGLYHKNGKWSYQETSLVVPQETILLVRSWSTHWAGNKQLSVRRGRAEFSLCRGRLDEAPRWDEDRLAKAASGLGTSVEILKAVCRKALPKAADRWDSAPEVSAEF